MNSGNGYETFEVQVSAETIRNILSVGLEQYLRTTTLVKRNDDVEDVYLLNPAALNNITTATVVVKHRKDKEVFVERV